MESVKISPRILDGPSKQYILETESYNFNPAKYSQIESSLSDERYDRKHLQYLSQIKLSEYNTNFETDLNKLSIEQQIIDTKYISKKYIIENKLSEYEYKQQIPKSLDIIKAIGELLVDDLIDSAQYRHDPLYSSIPSSVRKAPAAFYDQLVAEQTDPLTALVRPSVAVAEATPIYDSVVTDLS